MRLTDGRIAIDLKFDTSALNLSDFDGNFRISVEGTLLCKPVSVSVVGEKVSHRTKNLCKYKKLNLLKTKLNFHKQR